MLRGLVGVFLCVNGHIYAVPLVRVCRLHSRGGLGRGKGEGEEMAVKSGEGRSDTSVGNTQYRE